MPGWVTYSETMGICGTMSDEQSLQAGTVDMDSLLAALEDIRAGLSEEEFAEIERAMNAEYVEPLDLNS